MYHHFNRHIEGIDLDFWHGLIESHGRLVALDRGDYVCEEGMPTKAIGYVKTGYLIYTIDRYNKIGGFTFPEALFGDYPNCIHNLPARFDIIAGCKSEIWLMDATLLPKFCGEDPSIDQHLHRFAESAYNSLIDRYCSILASTPAERYFSLISQHPQIERDVPLQEIAQFLQITPTHLSRIRRELHKR